MNYFLIGLIFIFSVLGVIELIRLVCFSFTSIPEKSFTLIVNIENENECEYILESLIERIKWNSIDFKVFVLYKGENKEIKDLAEKLISKYGNITLLTYEDLNYNHIINF